MSLGEFPSFEEVDAPAWRQLGFSFEVGNLDADPADELLLSSYHFDRGSPYIDSEYGAVWILDGAVLVETAVWEGWDTARVLGEFAAIGDLAEEARNDVVITSLVDSYVLVDGDRPEDLLSDSLGLTFSAPVRDSSWVAAVDLTGDGQGDLATSSTETGRGPVDVSQVRVPNGPIEPGADILDAETILDLAPSEAELTTFDWEGDGDMDLFVAGYDLDDQAGQVFVFLGPLSGRLSAADADLSFAGEAPGDLAGPAVGAGDITGDGQADLVVGAPFHGQGSVDGTGRVYLLAGPLR